jgi:hypothetical protein
MRLALVGVLFGLTMILSACDEERAELTFLNSSEQPLCFGITQVDPELCPEVKPRATTRKKTDCYGTNEGHLDSTQ